MSTLLWKLINHTPSPATVDYCGVKETRYEITMQTASVKHDLFSSRSSISPCLYADTTLSSFHPSSGYLPRRNVTHAQNTLRRISSWMTTNLLTLLYWMFISSSSGNVGERITFSRCPSVALVRLFVRPFVRTDLVTTIFHERLEQSRWNLCGIFTGHYWWPD